MRDITGNRYGDLLVIGKSKEKDSKGSILWNLECNKCGEITQKTSSDLNRGRHTCLQLCRRTISLESPYKSLFAIYVRGAKIRKLEFDLTKEQFFELIKDRCNYCNSQPFTWFQKKNMKEGIYYNGVDRVDNKRGYTIDNCVSCCKFCNFAKSRFGEDEFKKWLASLRS